ncbi:MAG: AraC family transcriptional regulator [Eubacteriales bacterium]|nr:AraC family transcriptional regulator [Eubacteriales bacterium]MDD4711530.1 AraC family transcriptional regulator [Eubacteriales bacterium]
MGEIKTESALAAERMKQYILKHLHEAITAKDVAAAAGYSQYHAARVFKGETGVSPFEYIRMERLTASARALRQGGHRVLDVALDFVFDSHEGFTRAFAKGFGISPKKYAARSRPDGWLIPIRYLKRAKDTREVPEMDRTAVIFTQILERPARRLILRRSKDAVDYFSYCEEVGCGVNNASEPWDILTKIKEALYEPVGLWLPENMRPEDTGVYAHGVEVPLNYGGSVPEGFDIVELPPCKMLVFQGEPYDDAHYQEHVFACMERIEGFNPEVYGYRWAPHLSPRMQLAPEGWRGYIEMRPVELMQ